MIADALGKDYNFDKVEPIARDLYILYSNPTPYEVFPDAALFLDTIPKAGKRPFKLGVITNFDRRIHGVMDALDLSRHFDFLVCSEDAGASKPDPAIFAKAVEAAGLEAVDKSEEAVHVGDDEDKDIRGALDAGWSAMLIDRQGKAKESEATKVCESFQEVQQVLKLEDILKQKT